MLGPFRDHFLVTSTKTKMQNGCLNASTYNCGVAGVQQGTSGVNMGENPWRNLLTQVTWLANFGRRLSDLSELLDVTQ